MAKWLPIYIIHPANKTIPPERQWDSTNILKHDVIFYNLSGEINYCRMLEALYSFLDFAESKNNRAFSIVQAVSGPLPDIKI